MRSLKVITTTLGGILCFILVAGCAVRRVVFNDPITTRDVEFVRPGETTLQEVVERIGTPENIVADTDQLVADFQWSTTRSASLNLGYLFRLISPVSPPLTLSGTGINIEHVQFFCDKNLVVQSYVFGKADQHALIEFWPF